MHCACVNGYPIPNDEALIGRAAYMYVGLRKIGSSPRSLHGRSTMIFMFMYILDMYHVIRADIESQHCSNWPRCSRQTKLLTWIRQSSTCQGERERTNFVAEPNTLEKLKGHWESSNSPKKTVIFVYTLI